MGKKRKKNRDIKCCDCKTVIDIDLYIANDDYDVDKYDNKKVYVFCGVCGTQNDTKINN